MTSDLVLDTPGQLSLLPSVGWEMNTGQSAVIITSHHHHMEKTEAGLKVKGLCSRPYNDF